MKTSFKSALGFKQAGTLHSTTSTLAHPSSINKKVMFVKESANSKTPIQYKSMDPQETNSASSPSIKSIKSKKSTIAGDSMNDIVKSFTFTTTSKVQRKRAVDRSKSSRDMCFFCEYEQYFGGRFWMKRKMNKISS